MYHKPMISIEVPRSHAGQGHKRRHTHSMCFAVDLHVFSTVLWACDLLLSTCAHCKWSIFGFKITFTQRAPADRE